MKKETLVELLERRFVTADGVIIWNEQAKRFIESSIKNESINFAEWIKGWIELDDNSEWISNEGDNYTSQELYLKFREIEK